MGCFLPDKTLDVTFTSSFSTNQGMSIYIMNEASDNKPFDISSIEMTYSFTTSPPTVHPTESPTTSSPPTLAPTTGNPTIDIVAQITSRPTAEGQINENMDKET